MPPTRFEYLFVLLVYFGAGASILWSALRRLCRKRVFWLSSISFLVLGTIVDLLAIRWGWWSWAPQRVSGLSLLGIPIEEFIGFFIGHMLVVSSWEIISNDVA